MSLAVYPGLWERWLELAAEAPFLASYRWLKAREGRTDGPTFTFVIEREGAPVAGLFGTRVSPNSDEVFNLYKLLTGSPRTLITSVESSRARAIVREESPPEDEWFPNLVVVYPGYECFPVGKSASDPEVVAELVSGIAGWARDEEMRALAFLYTSPANRWFDRVFTAAGLTNVHLTHTTQLHVPGRDFDDYLGSLGNKRRREIKREIRNIHALGIHTTPKRISDCYDDLVRLGLEHSRKYGRRVSEEKERGKLDGLMASFGEDSIAVYAATHEDQLLAFTLFLEYRGEWLALDSGADPDDERARYLYFDTTFYAPIANAYLAGVRTIHYGMATLEAKISRGCVLVPRDAWILAIDPGLHDPVSKAGELLRPSGRPRE